MFGMTVDAVLAAMAVSGYENVPLILIEIGSQVMMTTRMQVRVRCMSINTSRG